jgi:hypothetical protein
MESGHQENWKVGGNLKMRIKSTRKRRIISRAKMLFKIFFPYPGVPGRLMIKVPPIIAITMSTLKRISIPSAVKCIYSFLVEYILPLRGQPRARSLGGTA